MCSTVEESRGCRISQVTEHASTKSDWVLPMSRRYAGLYCGIKIFASFLAPPAFVLQLSQEVKERENVEKIEHNERAKHGKRFVIRYHLTLWLQNISHFIAKFQPK